MNILLVHNRYQHAGGEDEVFRAEAALLGRAGHEVIEYTRANDDIVVSGPAAAARLAVNTVWARAEAARLRELLHRTRPDVAHFHNTLPLISPAAYYACREADVPVVQTLHNYRLICPSATLFREGRICAACPEQGLLSSVRHGCYRGSRGATAAVAAMLTVHRALGTWQDKVDVYVALSEFARRTFVAAGLPAQKVVVKPNFMQSDPGVREAAGDRAVFVGRFWPEKGARTMIDAWTRLRAHVPLEVFGDGPARPVLEAAASGRASVRFRGRVPREEALAAMKRAQFLVFPSEWYEGMPMTIVEAFACGVPVIASRLGTMAEIVEHGRTGLHFMPGNAADLAAAVEWAWSHPQEMAAMGRAARAEFEAKYTAGTNYQMLMDVYRRALARPERSVGADAGDTAPVAAQDGRPGHSYHGVVQ